MTATDELRRMLDERGVEYEVDEHGWVFFDVDGFGWIYVPSDTHGQLIHQRLLITPAQAIAATLGSCNCTNSERTGTWSDFDMQMAYHMGYDDALARRKPDAGKVVTNG